jgi:nitrate reductase assembly molybdenum cofactor insertion protein NarJ
VFLEFLSSLPPAEAAETLAGAVNVISLINSRLNDKQNIYRYLPGAVISLSATAPDWQPSSSGTAESEPENPDSSYDEPVSFSNENPCSNCK